MPVNKQGILKSAVTKKIGPVSPTDAEFKAGRELQASQIESQRKAGKKGPYSTDNIFGAIDKTNNYKTDYNRAPSVSSTNAYLKLVPGPSGTVEDLKKRTEAGAAKDMQRYMDYKKPGGEFKNLSPKPAMPSRLTPPSVGTTSPKMKLLKTKVNGAS